MVFLYYKMVFSSFSRFRYSPGINSLFFFFLIIVFSSQLLAQSIISSDELVVTVPTEFPPYYSTNEKNQPEGFAIDVFEAVAARAGIVYRYDVKQSWVEVMRAVQQGEGDIIPNLDMSTSQSEYVDFTSPVTTFAMAIFVRDSQFDIQSADDLKGKKVAVMNEDIGADLMKNRQDIQLRVFDEVAVAFYELMNGRVDALVYPEPVLWKIADSFELSQKVRVISSGLVEAKRAIAISKNKPRIKDQLEVALQALLQSEEYQQIYQKWFMHTQPLWNVNRVFWMMIGLIVLIVILFLVLRHRELMALKASLQQQIDLATLQLSESNDYLKDLTVTDALTGISNRRAFEHSLYEIMGRVQRFNESFSMLIFDIDDFKNLNDQFGHDMGDIVLKDLVDRIDGIVREVDVLSRWGGEEFTILMPRTDQEGAMKMAERCRSVVSDTPFDKVGTVTISLGATCIQANDNDRKFFKRADDALYQAKSNGKNRVAWLGDDCI